MEKVTVILGMFIAIALISCNNSNEKQNANKITIEDSNSGMKISTSVNEQKLPDDFPKDIYLIEGSKEHLTIINMGKQKKVSFYQHPKLSSKEFRTEIVKNMENNEWKTDINVASQLYFSKGKNSVRIGIGKDDDKINVSYIITY
jgi:ribosomal protein L31E